MAKEAIFEGLKKIMQFSFKTSKSLLNAKPLFYLEKLKTFLETLSEKRSWCTLCAIHENSNFMINPFSEPIFESHRCTRSPWLAIDFGFTSAPAEVGSA